MAESKRLFNRGFISLIVTQFFGAANDNILKGVLTFGVLASGVWPNALGEGGQTYIALCLSIPFIFLSGIAGQLADRMSKRTITVFVKVAEIGIAAVALFGFWIGSLPLAMTAMVLLAIQSAFFGPAKYGMIPELVADRDLSQANGAINMLTNIAIILGTLAAGEIYDRYNPPPLAGAADLPVALPWIPGAALVVIAIVGCLSCLFLPSLEAKDPDLEIDWNPLRSYFAAIREMARSPLLTVALAWSFFYMVGMIALLILPEYKDLILIDSKPIDASKASQLLGILGISIGIGSVGAGIISGKHIEPRLVPAGAIGMCTFFFLLGLLPLKFGIVAALLFGAGFFAGFYIVPLQALLQHLSPDGERGRYLGTANAMSFVASTVGSLIFLAARSTFSMPANRIFLICGVLALAGTSLLLFRLRRVIIDPSIRRPESSS